MRRIRVTRLQAAGAVRSARVLLRENDRSSDEWRRRLGIAEDDRTVQIDPEVRQWLESLGYLR